MRDRAKWRISKQHGYHGTKEWMVVDKYGDLVCKLNFHEETNIQKKKASLIAASPYLLDAIEFALKEKGLSPKIRRKLKLARDKIR